MKTGRNYKFWFCTGSQDLYGDECLSKSSRAFQNHCRRIEQERMYFHSNLYGNQP